jgi:hypothetical protein
VFQAKGSSQPRDTSTDDGNGVFRIALFTFMFSTPMKLIPSEITKLPASGEPHFAGL